MVRSLLLLLSLLLILAARSTSAADLAIEVNPRQGFAPLSVIVKLIIEPSYQNRRTCFIYDGPVYSQSCWDLTGSSPRVTLKVLKDLPEGIYFLSLIVKRADGSERTAATKLNSLSTNPTEF